MNYELGEFSFQYRSLAVHGFGISASSNFAVLYMASQLYIKHGAPAILEEIAREALKFDRWTANGLCVAADDVYPIVYGGVMKVHTKPVRNNSATTGVTVDPVPHDARWIADNVVVAFRPRGTRHEVADLLKTLFAHPKRVDYVKKISVQATRAADAISEKDIETLAGCVNRYRELFDEWTESRYINPVVEAIVNDLKSAFGDYLLAWKPPGAGAAEAIVVLVPDKITRNHVLEFFHKRQDWWCSPAYVTTGLSGEFIKSGGHVRLTAGHRLDFVGGADLGQSPDIRVPGVCCSCAIEPRSEIVLEGTGRE